MDELALYAVIFLVVALVKAFQKLLERTSTPRERGTEAPRGDPMGEVRKLMEEFVEGRRPEEPAEAPPPAPVAPPRPLAGSPRPPAPEEPRPVVRPVSAPPPRALRAPRRVGRREAVQPLAASTPHPAPPSAIAAAPRPRPEGPPGHPGGLAALLGRSDLSPAQRAVVLSVVLAPRGRWVRGRGR
ncbi:MAG: hypothetical protein HY722_12745 [Planctomycetes bacterium]|nr:hypothetical protein [Planctomycetota bacterium]